jgi:fructokinase
VARDVVRRARAGERAAACVVDRWLDAFGRALANVIDVLDPDVVGLGGLGKSSCSTTAAASAPAVFGDELRAHRPPPARRLASVIGAALLA